jgi:hypothetical protein
LSSIAVAALLALLAFGLAGCGSQMGASAEGTGAERASQASGAAAGSTNSEDAGPPAARPYEPLVRVVVTRDAQRLPAGCGPRQAAGLMTHFLDAYNKGDQEQLRRFFPARAEVQAWLYSMNRGRSEAGDSESEVVADNRKALLRYFAERHERHDRMRLLSVVVGPSHASSGGRPRADITYSLGRRADDLERGLEGAERSVIGKGVIDCRRQKILLLSMGTLLAKPEDASTSAFRCPEPAGRNQGDDIAACTGTSD